jgi:hypothetical protein
LRHTLSHQRGQCQRIQAVPYHHGCPQPGELMTDKGRSWLAAQPLACGAREQITVALNVIDALDAQLALLDKQLRAFARATSPSSDALPDISAAKDPRRYGGRCSKPRCAPPVRAARTMSTYSQAAERLGSNRARLSVARKILKRSYHLLRELGEEALAPA